MKNLPHPSQISPANTWLWLQETWSGPAAVLLAVWFLTMTAVPIAIWIIGPSSTPATMFIATLAQGGLILLLLIKAWGAKRAAATGLALAVLGWLVEWVGSNTGLPFGAYSYTGRLQPQLLHVPLLVPLAWFMMLPVCWGVADRIGGTGRTWRFAFLSAAAMTAWDLFLDPQMVNWGFWIWPEVPAFSYFGIPWQNYAGWFATSFLMTVLLRPPRLNGFGGQLVLIYAIIWLMQTGGLLLFWGLIGPAITGFIGMGIFIFFAGRTDNLQTAEL